MDPSPIAILGGGIAGISTAIALRIQGFDVDVFERHESPTQLGAGLVCWPNACFVLDKLGVLGSLRDVSGLPSSMRRLSCEGEVFGSIDLSTMESRTGQPSLSVLRKDLHAILLSRLAELGTDVNYGRVVDSMHADSEGTTVQFASGASIQADVIVGAEGRMTSVSRNFVVGHNQPRYQGFVNWIGTYEAASPIFRDMAIQDIWGVGLRFGIVPVSPTRAYWAAAASQQTVTHSALDSRQEMLAGLFSDWPDPVSKILASKFAEECREIHVHDHDPIDVWHRDNVLLIGDAAHAALPTSGQGACQALEDAWFLAKTLSEAETSTSTADSFSKFTSLRASKTKQIGRGARGLAMRLFATDPVQCKLRDAEARSADYGAMARGMTQLWWAGLQDE